MFKYPLEHLDTIETQPHHCQASPSSPLEKMLSRKLFLIILKRNHIWSQVQKSTLIF